MGLSMNPEKCEVTPSAGIQSNVEHSAFPGWKWGFSRNVKVLGAAVGDQEFCEGLVRKRRGKASPVLQGIAALDNSQCGFSLLRSCASFAKLAYNIRTTRLLWLASWRLSTWMFGLHLLP